MINDLIVSIGRQLNIPQSDDNEWVCRVVYSVAGQMALASLWDHTEDGGSVSIQHFKSRIGQIFDAYEGIYPKIGFLLPHDKTDLIEEMYSMIAFQVVPVMLLALNPLFDSYLPKLENFSKAVPVIALATAA